MESLESTTAESYQFANEIDPTYEYRHFGPVELESHIGINTVEYILGTGSNVLNDIRVFQMLQQLEEDLSLDQFEKVKMDKTFIDKEVYNFLVDGRTTGYTMLINIWFCLSARKELAKSPNLTESQKLSLIKQYIDSSILNHAEKLREMEDELSFLEIAIERPPPTKVEPAYTILISMITSRARLMRLAILIQSMVNLTFSFEVNYRLTTGTDIDLINEGTLAEMTEGISAILDTGIKIISDN